MCSIRRASGLLDNALPCNLKSVTGKRSQAILVKGNLWLPRRNIDGAPPIRPEEGTALARVLLRNFLPARWKPTLRLLASRCLPATGRKFPPTTSPISTIISTAHRKGSEALRTLFTGAQRFIRSINTAPRQFGARTALGEVHLVYSVK